MDISIIIVNYRTPHLTIDCVKSVHNSLSNENISYEIIIVDNYSNDGNIQLLKSLENENTHIVETIKNGGFGYGNNRGVEHSSGDYLFFLNSDTILYQNTLVNMYKYLQNHKEIGIMGCLMEDGDNNPLVTAHKFENTQSLFLQTIIKPFIPKIIKKKRGINFALSQNKVNECDWVSGAALLIPRSVFHIIDGWNEKYFLYMEDEELCYRVKQKGLKITVFPALGLQHLISQSGGSSFSAFERYRSKLIFYYTTGKSSFWFNRILLFIQANQYMKNLPKNERQKVIKKLREIKYD